VSSISHQLTNHRALPILPIFVNPNQSTMPSNISALTSESVQHLPLDTETSSPILDPEAHVDSTAYPALLHPAPVAFANPSVAVTIVAWFPDFNPSTLLLFSVPSFSVSDGTLFVAPPSVISL
jgi:hypothetical protein